MMVVVESPYAASETASVGEHEQYAVRAMRDSLARGESPMASHVLYAMSGVLDDLEHDQRERGIAAGLEWACAASKTVVYVDYGVSSGMTRGIKHATSNGRAVEFRSIGKN